MKNNKIINNTELEYFLDTFCKNNGYNKELFEIAKLGTGYGSGERKELYGPSNVKNKNCVYVIKLFLNYNLIVIWNYRNNKSMSIPYMTVKERLKNGRCSIDKGKFTHPNEQSEVLFENTENFEKLLNKIVGKI